MNKKIYEQPDVSMILLSATTIITESADDDYESDIWDEPAE